MPPNPMRFSPPPALRGWLRHLPGSYFGLIRACLSQSRPELKLRPASVAPRRVSRPQPGQARPILRNRRWSLPLSFSRDPPGMSPE